VAANPFAESTVGGLLDGVAARHPDREAIVFGDERIRFAELRDRSLALARGLTALGLGPGDKVAIWLPSRPAWFIAQQACARIGAVVVALNPRYRAHELSYILAQKVQRGKLREQALEELTR
jgi:fatty-acyl-CoA synthase